MTAKSSTVLNATKLSLVLPSKVLLVEDTIYGSLVKIEVKSKFVLNRVYGDKKDCTVV